MDATARDAAIRTYISEMRQRIDDAAGIAKAAETCSSADNIEKGIEIALDVEQLIYEVGVLLNSASLINRIGRH